MASALDEKLAVLSSGGPFDGVEGFSRLRAMSVAGLPMPMAVEPNADVESAAFGHIPSGEFERGLFSTFFARSDEPGGGGAELISRNSLGIDVSRLWLDHQPVPVAHPQIVVNATSRDLAQDSRESAAYDDDDWLDIQGSDDMDIAEAEQEVLHILEDSFGMDGDDNAILMYKTVYSECYPRLIQAVFDCLALVHGRGTSQQSIDATPSENTRVTAIIGEQIHKLKALIPADKREDKADPELNEYLNLYVEQLEGFKASLSALERDAGSALTAVEDAIDRLAAAHDLPDGWEIGPAPAESGGAETLSVGELIPRERNACNGEVSDRTKALLKAKFSKKMPELLHRIMTSKKKGKLPLAARSTLKDWWYQNLTWPYPSEDDKEVLGDATGLDATQINNWFINQRKRHWNKLFRDPPQTREEAEAMARSLG